MDIDIDRWQTTKPTCNISLGVNSRAPDLHPLVPSSPARLPLGSTACSPAARAVAAVTCRIGGRIRQLSQRPRSSFPAPMMRDLAYPSTPAAWRRSSWDGGDARAPRLSTHVRAPRRRTRHTHVAEGKGSLKVDPDVSRRHAADLGCRRDGAGISASGSNACGFHLTPTPRAPYIDLLTVLLSLIDRHWQGDAFTKVCGIVLQQNTSGFAC